MKNDTALDRSTMLRRMVCKHFAHKLAISLDACGVESRIFGNKCQLAFRNLDGLTGCVCVYRYGGLLAHPEKPSVIRVSVNPPCPLPKATLAFLDMSSNEYDNTWFLKNRTEIQALPEEMDILTDWLALCVVAQGYIRQLPAAPVTLVRTGYELVDGFANPNDKRLRYAWTEAASAKYDVWEKSDAYKALRGRR